MNKNDTTTEINSYVSLIFRMHHSKTSLTHTSNRKQLVHAHKIACNTWHTQPLSFQCVCQTQAKHSSSFIWYIWLLYCLLFAVAVAALAAVTAVGICLAKYWWWNCAVYDCAMFTSQNIDSPFETESLDRRVWVISGRIQLNSNKKKSHHFNWYHMNIAQRNRAKVWPLYCYCHAQVYFTNSELHVCQKEMEISIEHMYNVYLLTSCIKSNTQWKSPFF